MSFFIFLYSCVLKFILFDMNIAIPTFLPFPYSSNIIFHHITVFCILPWSGSLAGNILQTVFVSFNWGIVALQCCVTFYCTMKWISSKYTYIPSLVDLAPTSHHPTHVSHHRTLSWTPCTLLSGPTVYFIHGSALERRRQWHPTPVLWPGKSHGRRSLVGCSPWGR